jgi:hypothetical protein
MTVPNTFNSGNQALSANAADAHVILSYAKRSEGSRSDSMGTTRSFGRLRLSQDDIPGRRFRHERTHSCSVAQRGVRSPA